MIGAIKQGELPDLSAWELRGATQLYMLPHCWGTGLSTAEENVVSAVYSANLSLRRWSPLFYKAVVAHAALHLAYQYEGSDLAASNETRLFDAKKILAIFAQGYDLIDRLKWQGSWYILPTRRLIGLTLRNEPYWRTLPG